VRPIDAGPARLSLGAVLGVGAALLVACGASSTQLIPAGDAGHLQTDFDAIASSVQGGDCAATRHGVQQAQQDLAALPGTVSPRLLATLTTGVHTLAARAGTECKLNTNPATTTTGQTSTPTPTNTNTNTTTAPTNTNTQPTDTTTQPTDTNTSPSTTPADTTPATTVPDSTGGPPAGVGGTQAPGQSQSSSSDPSGGTPGGGN
jgi:cell division septation protein DedD